VISAQFSDSAAQEIQVTQPTIITQHCADVAKTGQKLGQNVLWCGTPKARNKIPNFQNPKAFILEGLDKN